MIRAGKSMVLCATQRTGSTLVFDDFRNVLGYEAGNSEILYDRIVFNRTRHNWSEIWEEVSQVNQIEGYFVDKVMFHYTPRISSFIERNSTVGVRRCLQFKPELFDAFYNFFEEAVWLYIDRHDVFAQAVSMYMAETTQVWERRLGRDSQDGTPASQVRYDFEVLKPYLCSFLSEREQWQVFFNHYNIKPVRITYEEAASSYPQYLTELLDRIGLRMVATVPPRRLLKLGDESNQKFTEFLRNDVIAELYSRCHARR